MTRLPCHQAVESAFNIRGFNGLNDDSGNTNPRTARQLIIFRPKQRGQVWLEVCKLIHIDNLAVLLDDAFCRCSDMTRGTGTWRPLLGLGYFFGMLIVSDDVRVFCA